MNGHLLLHHHVVRKHVGQFGFGLDGRCRRKRAAAQAEHENSPGFSLKKKMQAAVVGRWEPVPNQTRSDGPR
jgi:hypothetical protein